MINTIIWIVLLYVLSTIVLIHVAIQERKKYAILTYRRVMSCMSLPVFAIANLYIGVSIFKQLMIEYGVIFNDMWLWAIKRAGYLRLIYYVALSLICVSYLYILERWLVIKVIDIIWKYSYRTNIVNNITLLEEKKNDYFHDSEWYMETVCKLSSLYTYLIIRAHKRGRTDIAWIYEQKLIKLKNENRQLLLRSE